MTDVISVPNRYPCCGGLLRFQAAECEKVRVVRRCPSCEQLYEVRRTRGSATIDPDGPHPRRLDRLSYTELEEF